jgi:hypothetical protein
MNIWQDDLEKLLFDATLTRQTKEIVAFVEQLLEKHKTDYPYTKAQALNMVQRAYYEGYYTGKSELDDERYNPEDFLVL